MEQNIHANNDQLFTDKTIAEIFIFMVELIVYSFLSIRAFIVYKEMRNIFNYI